MESSSPSEAAMPSDDAGGVPMARPAGVTAAAVLSLLGGLLNLVGGYGAFSFGGWSLGGYVLPFYEPPPGGQTLAMVYLVLGFGAVLLGIGQLAFAWGAWNLADWAWLLGLGLAILGAAEALWGLLGGAIIPAPSVAGLLLPVLLGGYLLLPGTRRAFGLLTAAEAEGRS
jgi:hypothetical protein